MKIKEILGKVTAGEELSDDEKTFLEGYEEPNLDAVANAKGKKERLKLEAKIEQLTEQLSEKAAEVEDANAGASEMEKMQKQIEKLNLKFEQATTSLEGEKAAHMQTQRSNALKSIDVPWMDNVSSKYRDSVMSEAFDGIDTDDLKDMDVVKPIINSIIEDQASFVKSPAPSGAGTSVKETASISESGKITPDNVLELKGEALVNNLDAAWAAASKGE